MSSRWTGRERSVPRFFGLDMPFFIIDALSARYEAGADDPNRVVAFREHNGYESTGVRGANQHFAFLIHSKFSAMVHGGEGARIV